MKKAEGADGAVVFVLKKEKGAKKDNARRATDDTHDRTVYVYLASKEAVFLVTGQPKESKYSYGVPIVPLEGKYRAKDGAVYDACRLRGKRVVLNLRKDEDGEVVKAIGHGVKLVAFGFAENEVLLIEEEGEDS
jgi:hypothetical protein